MGDLIKITLTGGEVIVISKTRITSIKKFITMDERLSMQFSQGEAKQFPPLVAVATLDETNAHIVPGTVEEFISSYIPELNGRRAKAE